MTQLSGAAQDTTERSASAATLMAFDHEPAGPAVVVVVGRLVLLVVGALDEPGLWLQAAARSAMPMTPPAARSGPLRPSTTSAPARRWPRSPGGETTCRGR